MHLNIIFKFIYLINLDIFAFRNLALILALVHSSQSYFKSWEWYWKQKRKHLVQEYEFVFYTIACTRLWSFSVGYVTLIQKRNNRKAYRYNLKILWLLVEDLWERYLLRIDITLMYETLTGEVLSRNYIKWNYFLTFPINNFNFPNYQLGKLQWRSVNSTH